MRGNIGIGSKVNRLTVVGKTMRGKRPEMHWVCRCDCGSDKAVYVRNANLLKGIVQSCGCLHRELAAARADKIRVGWETKCAVCGKEFHAVSNKQNVCSSECRFSMYQNKKGIDDCWEWSGPKNMDRYGVLFLNKNRTSGKRDSVPAHRHSYERSFGVIPNGMCVMHSCDNPSCTNPSHLKLGTRGENNADRSKKGRSGKRVYSDEDRSKYSDMNRGTKNRSAKHDESLIFAIKHEHKELTSSAVAKMYGLGYGYVWAIRAGKSWRHI